MSALPFKWWYSSLEENDLFFGGEMQPFVAMRMEEESLHQAPEPSTAKDLKETAARKMAALQKHLTASPVWRRLTKNRH